MTLENIMKTIELWMTMYPSVNYNLAGYVMPLDTKESIQKSIYFGTYEPEETTWIYKVLKPGMTVVDAGSNIGYYSLIASSLVGKTGEVYSFDPSKYMYDLLRKIVVDNRIVNIHPFNLGLGDKETTLELYKVSELNNVIADTYSPSFCLPIDDATMKVMNIKVENLGISPVTTLDKFSEHYIIERIDLLKLDVEGYEPHIITGAKRLLEENRIRRIMIELNGYWLTRSNNTPESVDAMLRKYGFDIEYQKKYVCRPEEMSMENRMYVNTRYTKC